MKKILVVIVGPTGIGKTKIAIDIAKYFNTEIISSDSRQIYRELSIGTAVPNNDELNTIKHHFIHSHSINDYYNASQFEVDVISLLKKMFSKKKLIVMTGGSMLYIDAVCKGIDDLPTVDTSLRESLVEKFQNEGIENLRLQLKRLDPDYYSIADLKNPKRIIHALEICLMTGKPYSSFRTNKIKSRPFKIVKIGLNIDREILYNRINKRVEQMVTNGLIDEAKSVFHLKHLNALNTVGYKELFAYFEGSVNKELAIEQIKNNTRKYARKQLTWFRKDNNIRWFEPEKTNDVLDYINSEI
jgi:tRNA dimethylallyltransferase